MAPKGRKLNSNIARRSLQSASSRLENTTTTTVKISSQQKKVFLQPYIDLLVQKKITNNQKLPKNAYQDMIMNL